MNKKVEILITDGHHYALSHKDGAPFTSVDMNTNTYGSASPCDTEADVQSALSHAKEWAKREGNKPVVVDKRAGAGLLQYLEGA